MIDYAIFFKTLSNYNLTGYRLLKDGILTPGTLQRLRDNKPIKTDTIDKLCNYIGCVPSDIFTYTPNTCKKYD